QYKNPPLVSTVKFTARLLGEMAAKYSMSKPTVLPVVLTSVSWMPPVVLVKPTVAFCTAVNLSVCVALCALATAGATDSPGVPRTTAALAAATDVRSFMMVSPVYGALPVPASGDDPHAGRLADMPGSGPQRWRGGGGRYEASWSDPGARWVRQVSSAGRQRRC